MLLVAVGALLPGRATHSSELGAPPASAAMILDRAAQTALRRTPAVPGKGQFEYVKMLQGLTSSNVPKGLAFGIRFWQTNIAQTWSTARGPIRLLTSEIRERFFAAQDRAIARAHNVSLAQLDGVERAAPREFDLIQPPGGNPDLVGPDIAYSGPKLPTQPQSLLRAIEHELRETRTPPTPANVFNAISGGLLFDATSPALRAALYRVMAQLPGVQVLGRRTDAIGRVGIAVTIAHVEVGDEHTRRITLFDPRTSEELETEEIQLTPIHTPHTPTFPAGTPLNYTVFLTRGIVRSIKDLPGGGHIPGPDAPTLTYEKHSR